ncbi:MAG: hypothetical protein U9O85_01050 [Euryarchaeota archaeon]|nr:hypothetical protein [Euryarchaeota archaeon]
MLICVLKRRQLYLIYNKTITKTMIAGVSVVAFEVEPKSRAAEEIIWM